MAKSEAMARGVVKWYDRQRGEGFIQRFEGPDVHVPGSALLDREPGFLIEGQAVEFELLTIPGGFRARRVRVVDRGSPREMKPSSE
ncbi:MAG: cold shock domain-containing protein [Acidobacteriota bacterium]|nr:cold shock domain-containing protein [Acidobacteriota bacterium]